MIGHDNIQIETIHEGFARLLIATIPVDEGQTIRREIEDHGSAVGVLPFDPARRQAILVRQFRAPTFYAAGEKETLEAVAGGIEAGEDPITTVEREVLEEAGLKLHHFEKVAACWTMPGISTERMHLYLAAYAPADRVTAGGGLDAEHEGIVVEEVPLAQLATMADAGELTDMKAFLLLQTLRLRRPELFRV
ncbi:MAG TPA: NUDIX hydrolase [Xanthobacteraceae bacterium]|nr:NUDIX hydrolase [Xanthobacteraceae bacterium]